VFVGAGAAALIAAPTNTHPFLLRSYPPSFEDAGDIALTIM
jgi:hypothetical protein